MVKYAAFLKEKYQCLPVFADSEWPPSVGNQYIRLALIEHVERRPNQESVSKVQKDFLIGNIDVIERTKKGISISDVFTHPDGERKGLRVLIDGAPGVGKTTLCRKVSKDWAHEGFLSEYMLVVVLHLRDRRIAKAVRIEDLFYHDDPELQEEVVRQVRKTSGAGVLLIFDGFDELSEEERMDKSLFLDIIKGDAFSRCAVLVTSRPYASENLQHLHSVVRHVEILGFTKEQIHQCITNAIKDESKAQTLLNTLEQRLDIILLCYIPLNCSILLYVYQQQNFALPDTLTELFEIFILHALKRDAKIKSAHRLAMKICSLASLPSPLNDDLDHLCKLAFDGLVKGRMVFQYKEIETMCLSDEDMESKFLGLLTAFKSFSAVGDNMTYQFLHLTIQEFLAARWVATHMSPEEQAKFFKDHILNDHYRMMLLFLAGITKLENPSFGTVFSSELDFFIPEEERSRVIETEKLFFHLVHLLYEARNHIYCNTLACAVEEQTVILRGNIPPFFSLAFAFFLSRSSCTWKRLEIGTNPIHPEELNILFEQLEKELPSLGSVSVQQLQIIDGSYLFMGVFPIAVDKLARIVNIPVFRHLCKLEIMGKPLLNGTCRNSTDVCLSPSDLDSLHFLIRNGTLEELTLLGVPGMNDEIIENYIAPELAMTMTLKVFEIGSVIISNCGLCSIFDALEHNKSVETLHVLNYMCGDLRSLALAVESALKVNQTLKVLSFTAPIPVERVGTTVQYPENFYSGLFRVIASKNSTLKSLTITGDKFVANEEVELSLIGMLHDNKSLTSLSISVEDLPSNLLNALAVGLVQNTSLKRLCVKSWSITLEPSIRLFANALCQNSTLKTLVLDIKFAVEGTLDFVLGAENFASLLGVLLRNKSLTSITFIYPRFTDDELKAIARCLVRNGHIHDIELVFESPACSYFSQCHCQSVIQEEVDKYKRELFDMMYFVYHVYEIYHRPL